jgi:nucleotide-binding universal stress UspA family protein
VSTTQTLTKVVVSVDGSRASRAAVRWCAEHLPPGTTVVAICGISLVSEFALSVPPLPSDSERRIEDVFEHEWCAPLAKAGLALRAQLVHEDDAQALLDVAAREKPDALVIGKERHHSLSDVFSASPLHRIMHHLPCPLILVPTDGDVAT